MKLLKLIVLFAVVAFASCKTKTKMNYGMMGCYVLESGEKETSVSKEALKLYDSVLRVKDVQCYINKLTVTNDGRRYFSFVLGDLPDKISEKIKADSSVTIVNQQVKEVNGTQYYCYNILKTNGQNLVKIHFKQKDLTNSVLMDAVFETAETRDKFYTNADTFFEQMICEDDKKK
jgi:hypothetical protein